MHNIRKALWNYGINNVKIWYRESNIHKAYWELSETLKYIRILYELMIQIWQSQMVKGQNLTYTNNRQKDGENHVRQYL